MIFGSRRRFRALVARQLDVFAADEAPLLEEARAAERGWNAASAESAEEAYGDWQLVADTIADRLLDVREAYAATLDETAADGYRAAFARGAGRRFPRFAGLVREDVDR